MSEPNTAAFIAICNIFNTGDLTRVEDLLADDYIEHDLPPGIEQGVIGFRQLVAMYRSAFPDVRSWVEQVVAQDDLVAARLVTTGTHTGTLMGIPATGKKINIQEFHVCRFTNGKCVEHWGLVDMMTMMQQLGVAPLQSA
jgi:steroid delta-isomerase-like uncharacterized protein